MLVATAISVTPIYPTEKVEAHVVLAVGQYDGLAPLPIIEPPKPTPQEYLKNKVSDAEYRILNRIAQCESEWKNIPNHLYDGEGGRYTAYGPFQILKSTARNYSKEDRREVYTNIDIAIKIYKAEGTTPWNESRYCWKR